MPRFDPSNRDLCRFVTPDMQALLTLDYDQLHEFCVRRKFCNGLSVAELEERLDELRVFLLLAIIAKRCNLSLPGQWLAEPPPQLRVLWKNLYDDETPERKYLYDDEASELQTEYRRFMTFMNVPAEFGYQHEYDEEHRFTPSKAEALLELSRIIGVHVRRNLWR